ncbi:MAG: outer membrane protein assembly factor BamD [Desulfobacteraceae bacterium]|nr:outer membrane protein assembly factor BamD [Desulfobacteraceae bacterium]
MNRKLRQVAWIIVVLMSLNACAWFQSQEEKPADQLIRDGMDNYNDGKYTQAIEDFEKLRDWYPFSKYAILAELKVADAYYNLKKYEDAVFAYDQFEKLHPRNDAIPYVLYRIGRCYFNQIDTVDRDQTAAWKALDGFDRLTTLFPDSSYARLAEGHMVDCYKSLAGHDYYVGVYYYRSRHYKAALERFKSIIINYPDVGIHKDAMNYIANCEALISQMEAGEDTDRN